MSKSSLRHNSLIRLYVWWRRISQNRVIKTLKQSLKESQRSFKDLKKEKERIEEAARSDYIELQKTKEKLEESESARSKSEFELETTKKMLSDMMLWREKTNAQLRAEAEVFAIKHIQGRSNDNS